MSNHEHPIRIEVKTRYLKEHSDPSDKRYLFAYTITLHNQGPESVQLIIRHWTISDDNGNIHDVRGEGVVGEQPVIAAGKTYQYTSAAILETTTGTMEGSYKMLSSSGTLHVPIPLFLLIHPHALH